MLLPYIFVFILCHKARIRTNIIFSADSFLFARKFAIEIDYLLKYILLVSILASISIVIDGLLIVIILNRFCKTKHLFGVYIF